MGTAFRLTPKGRELLEMYEKFLILQRLSKAERRALKSLQEEPLFILFELNKFQEQSLEDLGLIEEFTPSHSQLNFMITKEETDESEEE